MLEGYRAFKSCAIDNRSTVQKACIEAVRRWDDYLTAQSAERFSRFPHFR